MFLARQLRSFIDLLYPSVCEPCGQAVEQGHSLCNHCSQELPRVSEPFCKKCGELFDGQINQIFRCSNCEGIKHDYEFARAALKGLEDSFALVHGLKYERKFFLARSLAIFLDEALEADQRFLEFRDALLVPVPLYWRRQKWRKGNQSYELSRGLTQLNGIPTINALKRIRATSTQTKLNRKQRLTNLHGAFQISKRHAEAVVGKDVILVDDVFTTGATAHECARVLKREGKARRVAVITLVRG